MDDFRGISGGQGVGQDVGQHVGRQDVSQDGAHSVSGLVRRGLAGYGATTLVDDMARDAMVRDADEPHAQAAAAPDDAAIEAPPFVGTDERRMQVRAYNFWAQMLGDRSLPSVEDLDFERLGDFGDHAVMLDFTAGLENPGITYLGTAIQRACGLDEPISYLSQVPGRSLLSRLTDHYLQIIANQAPVGFEAEFLNDQGLAILYRGILLPFSSDDDSIDFMLGVINWKEVAGEPLASSLRREVQEAVLHAPVASVTAPAWADGPDSQELAGYDYTPVLAEIARGTGDEAGADGDAANEADTLADHLAKARHYALEARDADARGRGALYHAIGRAYDFALAAEDCPADYAALLADAGLKAQSRAPMTPVVKLVFGADYDKTRLTEYATVIGHARTEGIGRGALARYLEGFDGGLKGVIKQARAARRGAKPQASDAQFSATLDRLKDARPMGFAELHAGDNDFVLLVARKVSDDQVGVVGALNDAALLDKVLRKICS